MLRDDPNLPPVFRPWYRYGWPWFLISIPACSVVLGFVMLYLGLSTNHALIVDDYYKAGKAINQLMARDKLATQYEIVSELLQTEEGIAVILSHKPVEGGEELELVYPPSLQISFVHATRADRDRVFRARQVERGLYSVPGAELPRAERWRVHINPVLQGGAASTWRLVSGNLLLDSTPRVRIEAMPAI